MIWICFSCLAMGQNSARVQELEKQRKEALAEIKRTSALLDQTQATTKDYLRRLNLLSQQILSRKKVISLLGQEINAINEQMTDMTKQIDRLETELKEKQQQAAGPVIGHRRQVYPGCADSHQGKQDPPYDGKYDGRRGQGRLGNGFTVLLCPTPGQKAGERTYGFGEQDPYGVSFPSTF